MTFIGQPNEPFETGLYIAFAAISGILFFIQVIYLQKLRMLPVYILPALSACICWENALLAGGNRSDPSWRISQFVTAIQALIIPFNVVIIFEMPFRLHQARTAHFLCIPFEQGELITGVIANISLWSVRIFAVGLLVIGLIVNFKLPHAASNNAGLVGFVYFNEIDDEIHLWLALLPPLILSFEAAVLSLVMQRYAKDFSLGVRNQNYYWRYLLPISLIYAATHTFGRRLYPVLSNGGDICLLIGESLMTHRVQLDLAVAGTFADFLHRSNLVFRTSQPSHPTSHSSKPTGPHNQQHHHHNHHQHQALPPSHHPHPKEHRSPSPPPPSASQRNTSKGNGEYSLVPTQQHLEEATLNGGDIEMNIKSTSSKEPTNQPPIQQVIQRDVPDNGTPVTNSVPLHDNEGNEAKEGNETSSPHAQTPPSAPSPPPPVVEENDVQISFTSTYQPVETNESIEIGENTERLDQLSPDQRSRVGRVSFAANSGEV